MTYRREEAYAKDGYLPVESWKQEYLDLLHVELVRETTSHIREFL